MSRPQRIQDRLTFGGRLPWAIGLLLSLVVGLSLLVAFGDRHAGSVFELTALAPSQVWHGQVWRLATWPFIEPGPLALIFTCLFIYWFGRDLAEEWGSRRFLLVFGGVMLAAAVATCLIALVDASVMPQTYLGGWALTTAMVVAWGLWFPTRVVRIYFILPITGFWLAWLTIAITVVYAVYAGWEGFLPELTGEAGILAWLFRRSLAARWGAARRSIVDQRRKVDRQRRLARSKAALRVVASHDDDELPPEIEGQLRDIFRKGKGKPPVS
jgi:membrane associated rhomboid family serine protease